MSNERCVWVADSQAMASVMAHWLDQEGVRTKVLDKTNLGISYGISFSKSDPHDHGWQVWVVDSEDLSKAKKWYLDGPTTFWTASYGWRCWGLSMVGVSPVDKSQALRGRNVDQCRNVPVVEPI